MTARFSFLLISYQTYPIIIEIIIPDIANIAHSLHVIGNWVYPGFILISLQTKKTLPIWKPVILACKILPVATNLVSFYIINLPDWKKKNVYCI